MILGALITGMGLGLAAMTVAIAADASAILALTTYWLASCAGTAGICVTKALFCKAGTAQTSLPEQSTQ